MYYYNIYNLVIHFSLYFCLLYIVCAPYNLWCAITIIFKLLTLQVHHLRSFQVLAAKFHSIIGWGMQRYSYGVYLVLYKYTSSNRHNTDTRTKSLPRLAGVLFRALSHNAFTTVAAHNRKPVKCFSVSKSGPHHPREPTALENFNRVDTGTNWRTGVA